MEYEQKGRPRGEPWGDEHRSVPCHEGVDSCHSSIHGLVLVLPPPAPRIVLGSRVVRVAEGERHPSCGEPKTRREHGEVSKRHRARRLDVNTLHVDRTAQRFGRCGVVVNYRHLVLELARLSVLLRRLTYEDADKTVRRQSIPAQHTPAQVLDPLSRAEEETRCCSVGWGHYPRVQAC
eukprot:scaffold18269_cov71-Phaeocystis_antarctica.AAC.10